MTKVSFQVGAVASEKDDVLIVPTTSVFDFGGGFVVGESPAGEVNVTLDIDEAPLSGLLKLAGRPGGQLIQGDIRLDGSFALFSNPTASMGFKLEKVWDSSDLICGIQLNPTNVGSGGVYGIGGKARSNSPSFVSGCRGLSFFAQHSGSGQLAVLQGAYSGIQIDSGAGDILAMVMGTYVYASLAADVNVPLSYGTWIRNFGAAGVDTTVGLKIDDQVGATNNYILELGAPYLQLEGSGSYPGGADDTPLLLAWGAGPTLARVKVWSHDGHNLLEVV